MKILCVDDEPISLERLTSKVKNALPDSEVFSFRLAKTALKEINENHHQIDLAFLDIEMIDMSGIELAIQVKQLCPKCKVCFVTGFSNYAVESYSMHIDGYILKPITDEALADNINFLLKDASLITKKNRLYIKTFGNFDLFYNDEVVHFERNKAKEVLAYLVDKKGQSATTKEILTAIYGDNERNHQKMLATLFVEIKKKLKEFQLENLVINSRSDYKINAELFDCDLYQAIDGDVKAINSYMGEYMKQYSWPSDIKELFVKNGEK